jgi:trehalose/maltose transport system substrate-binding protein
MPRTWAELGETGKEIAAKESASTGKEMWGYVFQGRAYEGLTCNALEWFASYGLPLLDTNGKLAIQNPKGAEVLAQFSSWIGTVSHKGVLSDSEEEARGAFQSGKAVFMRNWPYAWALLNSKESPVHGKVVMTALPSGTVGGPRASTLGGWALAISAYSKYPKEAADLLKFLTSAEQQKIRAIKGGMNPSLKAVYEDKEVVAANPHLKELKSVFMGAVARPARQTKSKYNRFSADFWNAVHNSLSKREKPAEALQKLENKVAGYSSNGLW